MRLFNIDDFVITTSFYIVRADVDFCEGDLGLMEGYAGLRGQLCCSRLNHRRATSSES